MSQQESDRLQHLQHPFLTVAQHAVERAAVVLRSKFQSNVQVYVKGTANFVTQADLESELAIVETIRGALPDHAIISEESHADRADSEHLWIIDPLDGTSNFMHRIPHFAISVAYYYRGRPELGIVLNPVLHDSFVVVRGQGAWHNGIRQAVDLSQSLDQVLIVCGFYYDRDRMMQATLDTIGAFFRKQVHGMRRFGAAALDLCNLGCGQFGVFFEYKLHPWDYAVGQLFVTEAGGKVTDCDGQPLPLDRFSSICATNASLHRPALDVIAPHWQQLKDPTHI